MINSDITLKNIKKESCTVKKSALALFIGFCTFIIILTISSFIIMNISIPVEYLFVFVLIASGMSAISCSTAACMLHKHRLLLLSMIISLILSITEFLIILCFNDVRLSYYVYFLFPIVIFCSFISSAVILNIKK